MFALPEAKRVRRKDLDDSASDSASSNGEAGYDSQADSALRAKLNAQLSSLLDFSFTVEPGAREQQEGQPKAHSQSEAPGSGTNPQQDGDHPEEEVFAFRLFRDEAPTHTVVLTNDEDPAALGDGGFVVPSRPHSHYVASPPSPARAAEYRSVAVSAEYLLADAKRRRWGLEKPWRVIHVTSNASLGSSGPIPKPAQEGGLTQQKKQKRTRPGKKHRILLRVREKASRERKETAEKLALEKEQHIQDKKKRLNRERKLKRRQKEREKKAELQTTSHDNSRADGSSEKDV